jgi:hypothetical protein
MSAQHLHEYDWKLWKDCDKTGHEDGCFVAVCSICGHESADCDPKEKEEM